MEQAVIKRFTFSAHAYLYLLVALVFGWLALPTLQSMVSIWLRSGNFAHGMVIGPLAAWLIYRQRATLATIPRHPYWPALIILAGAGLLWLLGLTADLLVVEQFAAMIMLISLVPLLAGKKFALVISFPLAYLFFAVPFGEQLTPWLQRVTADIAVYALQLSGIPVYVNGLFIEIPSGHFKVAEACSGIRYLIAALAVGTLYGYITYNSLKKRLLFFAACIATPIIANGIRAYLIILIAHFSDMKYAVGVDHLIYGWIFFGFVILLLFWIGSYWREDDEPAPVDADAVRPTHGRAETLGYVAALAIAIMLSVSTLGARAQSAPPLNTNPLTLALHSEQVGGQPVDWEPDYVNADRTLSGLFSYDQGVVDLYIAEYQSEAQNKELINQVNRLFQRHWTVASQDVRSISFAGTELAVNSTEIRRSDGRRRLIWHWFQIGEHHVRTGIEAKLRQSFVRIMGTQPRSRVFAISITLDEQEQGATKLERFIRHNWQPLLQLQ